MAQFQRLEAALSFRFFLKCRNDRFSKTGSGQSYIRNVEHKGGRFVSFRTQVPESWAHRIVRVSMSVDTEELASVGLLVCGDTAPECYGRFIAGKDGAQQALKQVVKDWYVHYDQYIHIDIDY